MTVYEVLSELAEAAEAVRDEVGVAVSTEGETVALRRLYALLPERDECSGEGESAPRCGGTGRIEWAVRKFDLTVEPQEAPCPGCPDCEKR